jgi:hypothetical protein
VVKRSMGQTAAKVTVSALICLSQGSPGRKSFILISPQVLTPPDIPLKSLDVPIRPLNTTGPVLRAYNALAEQALRAGVMIHSLDSRGLTAGDDNRKYQAELPLSEKTGGMLITSNNFF